QARLGRFEPGAVERGRPGEIRPRAVGAGTKRPGARRSAAIGAGRPIEVRTGGSRALEWPFEWPLGGLEPAVHGPRHETTWARTVVEPAWARGNVAGPRSVAEPTGLVRPRAVDSSGGPVVAGARTPVGCRRRSTRPGCGALSAAAQAKPGTLRPWTVEASAVPAGAAGPRSVPARSIIAGLPHGTVVRRPVVGATRDARIRRVPAAGCPAAGTERAAAGRAGALTARGLASL